MQIIEFRPGKYRNLLNQSIHFSDFNQTKTDSSIRFLVGLNGTGKTNLLKFIASVFLALEENFARPRDNSPAYNIPFAFTYYIRENKVRIESTGQGRSGVTFWINDEERDPGDIPARDSILPTNILVYTSGDLVGWRETFLTGEEVPEEIRTGELSEEIDELEEQDPKVVSEIFLAETESSNMEIEPYTRSHMVEPQQLKLALLAAMLDHQKRVQVGEEVNKAFEAVLKDIPVELFSFSLITNFGGAPNSPEARVLGNLYELANMQLQAWENQHWIYDLQHIGADSEESTLIQLSEMTGHDSSNYFRFFQQLARLQEKGFIQDVQLVINYTSRKEDNGSKTLLVDHLSDGEFAFLARMALIYLLQETECLFILDEPEVHFNDAWKRNLVDNIEQALEGTRSEVILTSHSSITLTDAYPNEIILLTHMGQENTIPLTLAAEQGELLRSIFGAERSVGERAIRQVNAVLEKDDVSVEELEELLKEIGPGYFRFQIVRELRKRVSSDQQD